MAKLIDISSLTKVAKNDDGLLPQPQKPKYRTALVEIYCDTQPMGGGDKVTNGHRFDTIPFANGMIKNGMSCQIVNYVKEEHDKFFEVLTKFDGVIVRCNPGQITACGGDQNKFDASMTELAKKIPVWPTPDVMTKMGAKDALCQIKEMDFGLPDTLGYYSPDDMKTGFKKTIAFQPRVVKQNRGSAGEGIWIIKLKDESQYCKNYGDRMAQDDEKIILKEANDNHVEEHTVAEFMEFCFNGRNDKSGTWTSKGTGKYFEGGKEAGGQMVDQRYLPRIEEGEARFFMVGRELYAIEHYVYIGGVGGETKTTRYAPDEPKFAENKKKLESEVEPIMAALGLDMGQLPLLWAADFIPIDNHKCDWVVGEFNCSCLGITQYLDARGKDLSVVSKADQEKGEKMCNFIGEKALEELQSRAAATLIDVSSIKKVATNDDGLLAQPVRPKYRTALVEIYCDTQPMGGGDKVTSGHRFDTIPFANGMIENGMSCQIVNYVKEEHDRFFQVLAKFDGVVVRCNPGQITACGGDQNKFDASMTELAKSIPVWPTPDVMTKMGAKDALCQIKEMDFGLPDTLGYYSPDDMKTGFKKTIAFQPRVVKQNRGSAGEGIWIIKLKDESKYCKTYGERIADDDEKIILKEANDNHVEEHSVAEFMEFCFNGRNDKSGTWTSKGTGKYFEGGKEAGGQMVDQRYLPRIEEGEARFFMVGRALYAIEHYIYIGGVGGETKTTRYAPDEPKFADNKKKLESEVEPIMSALGLDMGQLPLLWAADFIPIDNHKCDWVVGEFNCSCLGITQYLDARGKDLSAVSKPDQEEGEKMCRFIGEKALEELNSRAGRRSSWFPEACVMQ